MKIRRARERRKKKLTRLHVALKCRVTSAGFVCLGGLVGAAERLAALHGRSVCLWLPLGERCRRPLVQLAILLDYAFAVPSVVGGVCYALSLGGAVPLSALALAAASLVCLALGWVYAGPRSYVIVHGLWHLLGATS